MFSRSAPILLLALGLPLAASADHLDTRSYPVRVGYKLFRGVGNVVTSPVEIPYNMIKESQNVAEDSSNITEMCTGALVGIFTGLAYTVTRIGVGVFDIVTFPWPTEPLMYPRLTPSVAEIALNGGRDDQ